MVPIFIPIAFSQYVKKEDVYDLLVRRRKMVAFVLVAMILVNVVISWAVLPKLSNLYTDLKIAVPPMVALVPYVLGALAVLYFAISGYFLSTKPDKAKVDATISKYKDGEMINIKQFSDIKLGLFFFALMGLSVGYLVISIIVPIYNLTASM